MSGVLNLRIFNEYEYSDSSRLHHASGLFSETAENGSVRLCTVLNPASERGKTISLAGSI